MPIHTITILGPEKSGTTQLFNCISERKEFVETYALEASIRFYKKDYTHNKQEFCVRYYDFAPNSKKDKINAQLDKSDAICLVFDASDANWETTLNLYLDSGISLPTSVPIVLVGTKSDRLVLSQAPKLEERAKTYAKERCQQGTYIAVSSKDKYNIDVLSNTLLDKLPAISAKVAEQNHVGKTAVKSLATAVTVLQEIYYSQGGDCDPEVIQRVIAQLKPSDLKNESVQRMVKYLSPSKRTPTETPSKKTSTNTQNGLSAAPSSSRKTSALEKDPSSTSPIKGTNMNAATNSRSTSSNPTPLADTYLSCALRMAGMAIMLAALTSLIYLAAVAASLVSAVALTAVVDQMVLTVGGLFSMAVPAAVFGSACAALGISTTAGSGILAASASVLSMSLGYGLMRLGKKPTAEEAGANAVPTSYFALTLRIVGLTLLATALANLVYLALLAMQVLSAVAFTSAMNQMIVTIGTILGMTEPLLAFSNAAAAIGLSTAAASQLISATGSAVTMGLGFCLFRAGKPATATDNPTIRRALGTVAL